MSKVVNRLKHMHQTPLWISGPWFIRIPWVAREFTLTMDQKSLLKPEKTVRDSEEEETFLVTTYNPANPPFKKILERNKPILESSNYW
jgi:hypothetical protein